MKYSIGLIAIIVLLFYLITPVSTIAQTNFSCDDVTEIPTTECKALVALYQTTDGPNWKNNTNWLVTVTPSDWYGITILEGHISKIYLWWNQLTGPIPPELGELTHLTQLALVGNQLTGNIPLSLTNLSSLYNLFLQDNQLTGPIPPQIGSMSRLFQLGLSGNQLTGSIPPELGNLSGLSVLQLGDNQLTGEIPPELGDLNSERIFGLHLYNNQLTGAIPGQLGNLTSLNRLDLNNNQLEGDIPGSFTNLINLIDPGEDYDGSDGLNLEYNYLNIPSNYPDPSSPLDTFLSQKDLDWHLLQGFDQLIGVDGGAIQSLDSKVTITIPSSALNDELIFTYKPQLEPSITGSTMDFAGISFKLDARNDSGTPITIFNSPLTVNIHYFDDDISAIPESTLQLLVWDGVNNWIDASNTCDPPSLYIHDMEANTLSTNICHLSEFALFGQAEKVFLPLILH